MSTVWIKVSAKKAAALRCCLIAAFFAPILFQTLLMHCPRRELILPNSCHQLQRCQLCFVCVFQLAFGMEKNRTNSQHQVQASRKRSENYWCTVFELARQTLPFAKNALMFSRFWFIPALHCSGALYAPSVRQLSQICWVGQVCSRLHISCLPERAICRGKRQLGAFLWREVCNILNQVWFGVGSERQVYLKSKNHAELVRCQLVFLFWSQDLWQNETWRKKVAIILAEQLCAWFVGLNSSHNGLLCLLDGVRVSATKLERLPSRGNCRKPTIQSRGRKIHLICMLNGLKIANWSCSFWRLQTHVF